tara:strand:- start:13921 stop:14097 length:177 start_codon:yes stop_codon:yes gene_type:complete
MASKDNDSRMQKTKTDSFNHDYLNDVCLMVFVCEKVLNVFQTVHWLSGRFVKEVDREV